MNTKILKSVQYVLGEIKRNGKSIVVFYGLFILFKVADSYILKLYSEQILDMIQEEESFERLIYVTLLFFGVGAMIAFFKSYFNNMKTPQIIRMTQKMSREVAKKNLTVDYEKTEDPSYINLQEKAYKTLNSVDNGFQGIIHSTFAIIEAVISVSIYIIIVGISNMGIVFLALSLAISGYLLNKKASKYIMVS